MTYVRINFMTSFVNLAPGVCHAGFGLTAVSRTPPSMDKESCEKE